MNNFEVFSSELLSEKYYKTTHKSGLEIYVYPKDMSTLYGILSVNFGGNITKYEKGGKKFTIPEGCAHFLEHKLFDNSDGTNADDVFSSLGAYCNAYTSNEKTAYLFSATDRAGECLEHLMRFVNDPYFTRETVEKEVGIIAEEIRGCIDDPYDRCYLGMLEGMYLNDPVKNEICGSEESISHITPEILYKCCEDFYVPPNMILSVCGNISPDAVLKIVDEVLSDREVSEKPAVETFTEPGKVNVAYTERHMEVGKPLFAIGIKDVNIPKDPLERYRRSEAINILLHIMFSEAGDFYLDMLERGLVAPGFDVGYSANEHTAYIMMSGESDDPKALLSEIKEQISKNRKNGLDKRDFEREKKCMYASYISDFDLTEDIAFSMSSYASERLGLFVYPELINSIDFEYVNKLADEIFNDEYFTLSVVLP